MTQEEKQLLFKDLCARLPYGVKVLYTADGLNEICELDSIMTSRKHKDKIFVSLTLPNDSIMTDIESIKPYLRPMSSMTPEEEYEYHQAKNNDYLEIMNKEHHEILKSTTLLFSKAIDFLNSHYLDYRGLIEIGLVLEASKDMYDVKY